MSELVGDIIVNCTGTAPAPVNFKLTLNVPVTNRIYDEKSVTDALLLIDEPAPKDTRPSSVPSPASNAVLAKQEGTGRLVWTGIPILAPDSTGARIFRMTNIRANANALKPGDNLTGRLEISAGALTPISSNFILGTPQQGFSFSVSGQVSLPHCVTTNFPNATNPSGMLRFQETFPNAFKTKCESSACSPQTGRSRGSESGFLSGDVQIGRLPIGQAFSGTRLEADWFVPQGVTVVVPATVQIGSLRAQLVQDLDIGSVYPAGLVTLQPNSAGFVSAFYEITGSDPQVTETLTIPYYLQFTSNGQISGSPATGAALANGFPHSYESFPFISMPNGFLPSLVPTVGDRFPYFFNSSYAVDAFSSFVSAGELRPCNGSPASLAVRNPLGTVSRVNLSPLNKSQSVTIFDPGSIAATGLSMTMSPAAPWLTATLNGNTTPATLSLDAKTTGMQPGTYSTTVNINSSNAGSTSLPVNLLISPGPNPRIYDFGNVTSYQSGVFTGGEVIVYFGPTGATDLQLGTVTNGRIDTTLAGTGFLLSSTRSPMIYASPGTASAITPFLVASRQFVDLQAEVNGQRGDFNLAFGVPAVPGLSTLGSLGYGPLASLNQDGSFNTPTTPAKAGDVVVMFGTGGGQTTPAGVDGGFYSAPLPTYNLAPSIWVDGKRLDPSDVLFFGPAPNQPQGVFQANFRIPPGTPAGAIPVVVKFGSFWSQPGTTIQVR
jgi:uncharacterized protein (TIGR03437 family)